MIRRLHPIACGLLLLICAASAVLWVMSSREHVWWLGRDRADASVVFILYHGGFDIHSRTWVFGVDQYYDYGLWQPFVGAVLFWASPFIYRRLRSAGGLLLLGFLANVTACAFGNLPAFVLVLFFDLMLFVLMIGEIAAGLARGRQVPPGICAFCGYDLRATPGRCPECGRVPDRQVRAGV